MTDTPRCYYCGRTQEHGHEAHCAAESSGDTTPFIENVAEPDDEKIERLEADNKHLKKWVHDLQSGQYVNCVYCGHQYGPREDTPVSMADVLKEHISKCPEHPLSKMREAMGQLEYADTNGCMSGDCSHYEQDDCFSALIDELRFVSKVASEALRG